MRTILFTFVVVSILVLGPSSITASQEAPSEMQLLKARQKEARKAMKIREKDQKRAFKDPGTPKGVRRQAQHDLQRQKRALREQQRNERQRLKDNKSMMHQ